MIRPVPGTLLLVLGAPGALKSMLSLSWCLELDGPTRIVSLDTDPATQAGRTIARLTGRKTSEILETPESKAQWAGWLREQELKVRFLNTPIAAEDVGDLIAADKEYWGETPGLVVIDDVSKLRMKERGYQDFDTAMLELHRTARKYNTVLLGLHHLHRGGSSARTQPISLHDGKYTGEYEAEIVLGMWRPEHNVLRVGVLKNRFGADDPTGKLYAELYADPANVEIRDRDFYQDAMARAIAARQQDTDPIAEGLVRP
jgi:predicted ATP-dependent serine protease